MEMKVIEIVEDVHHTADEEAKLSSTSGRKRMLAKLLRKPKVDSLSRFQTRWTV